MIKIFFVKFINYVISPLTLQPEDWDDREYIPDPEDEKPEVRMGLKCSYCHYFCLKSWTFHQGYDDIPKEIPDPDSKKVLIICQQFILDCQLKPSNLAFSAGRLDR